MTTSNKGNEVQIQIPPIQINEVLITIIGDSPLLVHKFSEKAKAEILAKQMKKAKTAKEAKDPVGDFIQSLHWITPMPEEMTMEAFEKAHNNGAKFGFPTIGIKQSAISAAYRNGLAKNKVSIQGAFHIIGELAEIEGELSMRKDYCKLPMAGADIVYRGQFDNWKSTFMVRYDANSPFSIEQIIHFINMGGFSVGIGDWRPEKGGNFGMFHVK